MRMLWQNTSTGDRSIWLMNGASWNGSYAALPNVPPVWSIAGSGDFNADGQPDIVWQNVSTGDRSIWFMNGNTWNGTYALLPNVSGQWSIAGVGDFNGDGKPDIVWQNLATGDRSVWYMNGSTWSGSYALLPNVSTQWSIGAVADFNADGNPDLVWQNTATGQRSIWFMSGATWSGNYALLMTVPPSWRIAAAADFDGDGRPDLVWQNVSTGERSIWFMNGSAWNGNYALLPTVPTQWSIAAVFPDHPTSTDVVFRFCADSPPIWVGYQDNGGPWTQATPGANASYSFHITGRGGIATVTPSGSGYDLEVIYATGSELASIGPTRNSDCTTTGQKSVTVSWPALQSAVFYQVNVGPASTSVAAPATQAQVDYIPNGFLDAVAVARGFDFNANGLIIRRAVNPTDGGTIDLTSVSWTTPASANLTVNNLGTDVGSFSVAYSTSGGASVAMASGTAGASQGFVGVPSGLLVPGDLHSLVVSAGPNVASPTSDRVALTYFYTVSNRIITLGPSLSVPTITQVATSPYARYRAQWMRQTEYDADAAANFQQSSTSRIALIEATAAYIGAGTTWDLSVPDLTAASGFNASWGFTPGVATTWSTSAYSGSSFSAPTANATILYAVRNGSAP
jgi:hypothetical protein